MGVATESQFHVLAVDDSLLDRKLIERLLKTSKYQVTTVDSGSKALEFLGLHVNDQNDPNTPSISPNSHREVEVNLIITDYCMPGMTGYDLLKKIKESSFRNIPVVIMSSENVQSRITRCLEEGAEEFFLKPVRAADLHKLKNHMMKTKLTNQKQEIQERLDRSEIPNFVLQEHQLPQLVSQELHHQPMVSQELQQQPLVQQELQQRPQLVSQEMQQQPLVQQELQQQQQLVSQEMQQLLALQELQQHHAVSQRLQEQQPSMLQEVQEQQFHQPMLQEPEEEQLQGPISQEQLDTQQQSLNQEQQKQSLTQSSNNKRKSMEEGLSHDCARPRYDGITTMV